jgi:hypothetical protein
LGIQAWPELIPTLLHNLGQQQQQSVVLGSLSTIRKIMEDGPRELHQEQLDALMSVLLHFLSSTEERVKLDALQAINSCLMEDLMPSALVANFTDYLAGLSRLATDPSPKVRKWVCRSIVTL